MTMYAAKQPGYAAGAANPYQDNAVSTASPAELVLMLYDRVLVAVARSRHAMAQDPADAATMHTELLRAQDIVTELKLTLDFDRGGEVAANLASLYTYALERLVDANVAKDLAPLDEVESTIRGIRDAWEQANVRPLAAVS
jgi:flagellar protein FliS